MTCTNCDTDTDTTCNGIPACAGCLYQSRQYPDN
jgi:hypothetical protein